MSFPHHLFSKDRDVFETDVAKRMVDMLAREPRSIRLLDFDDELEVDAGILQLAL